MKGFLAKGSEKVAEAMGLNSKNDLEVHFGISSHYMTHVSHAIFIIFGLCMKCFSMKLRDLSQDEFRRNYVIMTVHGRYFVLHPKSRSLIMAWGYN